MRSFLLDCVRAQVAAVVKEIDRLEGSEFPYTHSKEALDELRRLFSDHKISLAKLTNQKPSTIDLACNAAFASVRDSLEILGFILRSTNVRNAFEVYGPLLRLARQLLERDTKLLTSSEWSFSPFTYIGYEHLPGFVLIGLPATESANPFLVPLAGHELGHSVWVKYQCDVPIRSQIEDKIIAEIKHRWDEYLKIFGRDYRQDDLNTNFWAQQTWRPAWSWAKRQAEELFCDLLGLRIFGESYLYAFAYLLAPLKEGQRQFDYPNLLPRATVLTRAAKAYGLRAPDGFEEMFKNLGEPQDDQRQAKYLLSIADSAREEVTDGLVARANEIVSEVGIPTRFPDNVNRCKQAFRLMVPVQKSGGLANILNAAWEAFVTDGFFLDAVYNNNNSKQANLKEIVLKSIEVLEIELRLGKSHDSGR